jgi:TetR/AcrR family transcriptional regulator of autoinduction and epiphytic fitness
MAQTSLAPNSAAPKKHSFKQQQMLFREAAILDTVNQLLSQKGFDLMTMDEVAANVGIAKASLYKHFVSKEALAAASMARLLEHALDVMANLPEADASVDKLRAIVRWSVSTHLQGTMPLLPSTRSTIQSALQNHAPYMDCLGRVVEQLGAWIQQAQSSGELSADLPGEVMLYTIFARSCDPVADFLKQGGAFTDQEITEMIVRTTFQGMMG